MKLEDIMKIQETGLFPYSKYFDSNGLNPFYMDCCLNQYAHAYPKVLDKLLKQFKHKLKPVAKKLWEKFETAPIPVYRGVFVTPDTIQFEHLPNVKRMTYLSFSEDPEIANYFANPTTDMNIMMSHTNRTPVPRRGYVMEHIATENNVLFCSRWSEQLGLFDIMAKVMGPNSDLRAQKEVVLWNENINFKVKEFTNG